MFAEIKKNGKWQASGKVFKSRYYNPEKESSIDVDGYEWNVKFTDEPWEGRNYDLFAILADVRNGRGFAGIKTGEGFVSISDPKGIPEDVTPEIRAIIDEWDGDGHSHSYFTAKELSDYDWNQITGNQGCITLDQFRELMNSGEKEPNQYCGAISGSNIETIDENRAKEIVESGNIPKNLKKKRIYVLYKWWTTYKDAVGSFYTETIPMLAKMAENLDNVRIVFFFDN